MSENKSKEDNAGESDDKPTITIAELNAPANDNESESKPTITIAEKE